MGLRMKNLILFWFMEKTDFLGGEVHKKNNI